MWSNIDPLQTGKSNSAALRRLTHENDQKYIAPGVDTNQVTKAHASIKHDKLV